MVVDYIKANADKIDRNGDGVIGYVISDRRYRHIMIQLKCTRKVSISSGTGVEADGDVDSNSGRNKCRRLI